jgi:glycosyltransferase involved in cell wall biosynthesis
MTLISVITPTWRRHIDLIRGAIPSVAKQVDVAVEHIVVSDGPDPVLRQLIPEHVRYFELPEHDPNPHWGAPARNFGLTKSAGDYIAYLDDDDLWEDDHLVTLLHALETNPSAQWARSCATIPVPGGIPWRIGDGPLMQGRIGAGSMILHRASLPAPWVTRGDEDWLLVKTWDEAGIEHVCTGYASVTYRPSTGVEDRDFVVTL